MSTAIVSEPLSEPRAKRARKAVVYANADDDSNDDASPAFELDDMASDLDDPAFEAAPAPKKIKSKRQPAKKASRTAIVTLATALAEMTREQLEDHAAEHLSLLAEHAAKEQAAATLKEDAESNVYANRRKLTSCLTDKQNYKFVGRNRRKPASGSCAMDGYALLKVLEDAEIELSDKQRAALGSNSNTRVTLKIDMAVAERALDLGPSGMRYRGSIDLVDDVRLTWHAQSVTLRSAFGMR